VKQFQAPKKLLADLDADAAGALITAAADVALIVDRHGVIRDLALGSEALAADGCQKWLGKPWIETVTMESRGKIEALLRDAAAKGTLRSRHVNHPSQAGGDVPVLYSAIQVGQQGRVVALGRDLREMATLQQRLVDAQQSMERDYARLRHAETRYRLLFQLASEAVLVVDAVSQKVVEANPAASQVFGEAKRIVGRSFPEGFDRDGTQAIQLLLADVRATGRAQEIQVRSAQGHREFLVSASLFRQETASHFLVRLAPLQGAPTHAVVPRRKSRLLDIVENSPDGFVVTDPQGAILSANRAFLDLAQLVNEEQARGEALEHWLGRPGVDTTVLLTNLMEHGSVRLFATLVRGEYGSTTEVEVSAVSVVDGEQPCLGFTIRNVGRRLRGDEGGGPQLPKSPEQLTQLIGRVPLKDLVRDATDVIERMCIEAALHLTGDNRASAAEMLGLSRQSLYVKLRRYGLGDLDGEPVEQE
jgi:transcriptional regulator PpsR